MHGYSWHIGRKVIHDYVFKIYALFSSVLFTSILAKDTFFALICYLSGLMVVKMANIQIVSFCSIADYTGAYNLNLFFSFRFRVNKHVLFSFSSSQSKSPSSI